MTRWSGPSSRSPWKPGETGPGPRERRDERAAAVAQGGRRVRRRLRLARLAHGVQCSVPGRRARFARRHEPSLSQFESGSVALGGCQSAPRPAVRAPAVRAARLHRAGRSPAARLAGPASKAHVARAAPAPRPLDHRRGLHRGAGRRPALVDHSLPNRPDRREPLAGAVPARPGPGADRGAGLPREVPASRVPSGAVRDQQRRVPRPGVAGLTWSRSSAHPAARRLDGRGLRGDPRGHDRVAPDCGAARRPGHGAHAQRRGRQPWPGPSACCWSASAHG